MILESLNFLGITYSEPATSITDVILCVLCLTLVARIKNNFNESFFNNAWRLFFLFTGFSTGLGAICHGFRFMIQPIFNILWMAMTICCSISVYFALKATIRFSRAEYKLNRLFQSMNLVSLLVFITLTIVKNDFEIFKIHAAIGLFLIFLTHIIAYLRSRVPGSGSIVIGMLLSFFTVYIHSNKISISDWFDFKDISHVIMMISLAMIYNGIYKMKENLKLSSQRLKTHN